MADRSNRAKKNKFSLEGLKEAREGGVSRLDQLEVSCKFHCISQDYSERSIVSLYSWKMKVTFMRWLMKINTRLSWNVAETKTISL